MMTRCPRRRGIALAPALVCLVVVSLIAGVMLRQAALQRRLIREEGRRAQADWLVESGLALAAARVASDPAYRGETWNVLESDLEGGPAEVRVVVEPIEAAEGRRRVRVRVAAEYPRGAEDRIRASSTTEINVPAETPRGTP